MEIKPPPELNTAKEKVLAWLERTQTSPSKEDHHPLGSLGAVGAPQAVRREGWTQVQTVVFLTHQHHFLHPEPETHPWFRDTENKFAAPSRHRR